MFIIAILVSGVVISLFEIPPLVKKKYWKEIVVYSLFLSAGMTVSILLTTGMTIPNPSEILMLLFSPVDSFIEDILS